MVRGSNALNRFLAADQAASHAIIQMVDSLVFLISAAGDWCVSLQIYFPNFKSFLRTSQREEKAGDIQVHAEYPRGSF